MLVFSYGLTRLFKSNNCRCHITTRAEQQIKTGNITKKAIIEVKGNEISHISVSYT